MSQPLGAIAEALRGRLIGDANLIIHKLSPVGSAAPGELSFVSHARYARQIDTTQASALLVPPALVEAAQARGACIVVDDAYLAFARLTQWWRQQHDDLPPPRLHPQASIDPSAVIGQGVDVGPFAVIEAGARIGDGARIGAHAVVGRDAVVGDDTVLYPRVVIGGLNGAK